MNFSQSDVRKCIYYCWKRGLAPAAIAAEMNSTLGPDTVSERTCRRWVAQYTDGNFVVDDKERSGRPSLDINDAIQQQLDVVKYATTRTIAEELGVSHITIGNHLREMGKKYLCNRWIPHHLTEEQMANRERICNELLLKFAANDFLGQLVTMDEIWIYWDNEGSFHHRSWRGEGDTPDVEVRRVLTTRKHLMSVFWDCKGVLLMEVLPRGQTITADVYCQQLDHLVVAIQEKRRRQLQGGYQQFHYLHDNARPHTAGKTLEKLRQIGFTVLPHPPYSPDLAPSDFYLFSAMKSAIRGRNWNSEEEIRTALDAWIASKPRGFFADGIRKLPGRWQKCVSHHGDYFEHIADDDD
jgi:[histone H3]-lysine36 N-dimethyltransferase SETMAR